MKRKSGKLPPFMNILLQNKKYPWLNRNINQYFPIMEYSKWSFGDLYLAFVFVQVGGISFSIYIS